MKVYIVTIVCKDEPDTTYIVDVDSRLLFHEDPIPGLCLLSKEDNDYHLWKLMSQYTADKLANNIRKYAEVNGLKEVSVVEVEFKF